MSGEVIKVSKAVIPNYVAEYIEDCKDRDKTLYSSLQEAEWNDKVEEWLWDGTGDESFSKFARAWLDGFHVEEEMTFKLRLDSKVVAPSESYLNKNIITGEYYIIDDNESAIFQTVFTEEDVEDLDLTGFVREIQLPF